MTQATRTISGRITAPDYTLPKWAQDKLVLTLWDRDRGPDEPILRAPLSGPTGRFSIEITDTIALKLAIIGHREGPQHIASIGWGDALNPALAQLDWPVEWAAQREVVLGWQGQVTLLGYVEQLHLLELVDLPLVVLEVAGNATPYTYRRLPPLPLSAVGDRHGLDADRPFEDADEQVFYLLADAETPLSAIAQDALVSNLRVVCVSSLGPQEGQWHEIVNLPLILDEITLIGP